MQKLVIRLFINAAALWVAARFVDGVELTDAFLGVLLVALVFGVVNALIKPVVKLLSLPFIFLTLGLFTLVINGAMLYLAATLTDQLTVTGFWSAVGGGIVISVVSFVLSVFLDEKGAKDGR